MNRTNDDLRQFSSAADSFFTVAIPAPSNRTDAGHRFDVEWRNARRALTSDWDEAELARVDDVVDGLTHAGGEALVLAHALGGPTLVEFLDEPIAAGFVHQGPVPRLAVLIEARQRSIAHVVVETDRAGADLTAFDGGDVLATSSVDGETLHIHRGHPGGWSQRRFQQRAENTWESNARDVADAVAELARRVDAQLVAVAGDVRAQTFVLESLPEDVAGVTVKIEAGSPDGIAAEVVRLLADITAREVTAAAERVRNGLAHGVSAVDVGEVLAALRDGRVETLLVHDDGAEQPALSGAEPGAEGLAGARTVDAAIAAALRTDAEVLVVPNLAFMTGPAAAILRW